MTADMVMKALAGLLLVALVGIPLVVWILVSSPECAGGAHESATPTPTRARTGAAASSPAPQSPRPPRSSPTCRTSSRPEPRVAPSVAGPATLRSTTSPRRHRRDGRRRAPTPALTRVAISRGGRRAP